MAAVAGAVVASELSGVSDGDAAEVGAHAEDDKPLGVFHALAVGLGVAQGRRVNGGLGLDLGGGSVADKQGLASPLEGHVLTCNHNTNVKLKKLLDQCSHPRGCLPA